MKVYDYSFKTGATIGDLYSPKDDTCFQDWYQFTLGLVITSPDVSGINSTRLSCNGQTLAEQNGTLVNVGFDPVYLNSGDYYFRSGENYNFGLFNENFQEADLADSAYFYNLKDDLREIPMGTGADRTARQTNLRTGILTKFPEKYNNTGLNSFDYFANGQKLYSGVSGVGGYRIIGSLFLYYEDFSGKIFAIPKNSGLGNITGENADIYGQNYVESTVFGYINGASLHKNNWLELSTGVTLIKTGVQASIFEPVQKTEIIEL